jgi:hypothetical protein
MAKALWRALLSKLSRKNHGFTTTSRVQNPTVPLAGIHFMDILYQRDKGYYCCMPSNDATSDHALNTEGIPYEYV